MFQPFFAAFLSTLAVVGFYHLVFPLIVYLAINYIRVVNKTHWVVEVCNNKISLIRFYSLFCSNLKLILLEIC